MSSAYANFVGYDEVAHHSGPRKPDALDALRRIDDRIALLCDGFADASRPYELFILSDHGQSQGSTFLQRYGLTLSQLIGELTERTVSAPETVTEGWANVHGILADVANDDASFASRTVKRLLTDRIRSGMSTSGQAGTSTSRPVTKTSSSSHRATWVWCRSLSSKTEPAWPTSRNDTRV